MSSYGLRVIISLSAIAVTVLTVYICDALGVSAKNLELVARRAWWIALFALPALAVASFYTRSDLACAQQKLSVAWTRILAFGRMSQIPRMAAIALLLGAPVAQSRDYFLLMRWLVCGAAGLTSVIAFRNRRLGWQWVAVMIAVLFNPLAPIRLARSTWSVVDPLVAAWFTISLFAVREESAAD